MCRSTMALWSRLQFLQSGTVLQHQAITSEDQLWVTNEAEISWVSQERSHCSPDNGWVSLQRYDLLAHLQCVNAAHHVQCETGKCFAYAHRCSPFFRPGPKAMQHRSQILSASLLERIEKEDVENWKSDMTRCPQDFGNSPWRHLNLRLPNAVNSKLSSLNWSPSKSAKLRRVTLDQSETHQRGTQGASYGHPRGALCILLYLGISWDLKVGRHGSTKAKQESPNAAAPCYYQMWSYFFKNCLKSIGSPTSSPSISFLDGPR